MTAVGQVVDELRSAIVDGTRAPGERLPSEPDLARTLGISRPTLRDALRALEDEGLVRRVHGSGTYVTGRPLLVARGGHAILIRAEKRRFIGVMASCLSTSV